MDDTACQNWKTTCIVLAVLIFLEFVGVAGFVAVRKREQQLQKDASDMVLDGGPVGAKETSTGRARV